MKRFIEGEGRTQSTLFPACPDDYIAEDNPVRVVDAFVEELDLGKLGFEGMDPEPTGRCTPSPCRRVRRWEHEAVIDAMQERLDRNPTTMKLRRQTVEHPFGTLKAWMGAAHFLTRTLPRVTASTRSGRSELRRGDSPTFTLTR